LGRVRVLEGSQQVAPGSSGLAQLRLEAPVVAVHGDRFILRSCSPAETIAGGVIVDPFATKHRGRELEHTLELLRSLMRADKISKFESFVRTSGDRGLRINDLAAATGWTNEVLAGLVSEAQKRSEVIEVGGLFI